MIKNILNRKKVLVAISGGVDSSVLAALLKKAGYEVVAVYMRLWSDKKTTKGLKSQYQIDQPYKDAQKVAKKIGIPLMVVDLKKEFKQKIVNDFLKNYSHGQTPNPCVRCNKFIKFGLLMKKMKEIGADYIATGHYARIRKIEGDYQLLKGKDSLKDQSYFLYTLKQDQLKKIIFPVGQFTKNEVRDIGKRLKLGVEKKAESQEICFVPYKNHNLFLKKYLKIKSGLIKTTKDVVVGQHDGLPFYTLGQRKGVKIGGSGPYYVVGFDYRKNVLYVSNNKYEKGIYSKKLVVKDVNWLSAKSVKLPFNCVCSVRFHHQSAAVITKKIANNQYLITFKTAQRAITPGQSAVFYKGEQLLGGGIIRGIC